MAKAVVTDCHGHPELPRYLRKRQPLRIHAFPMHCFDNQSLGCFALSESSRKRSVESDMLLWRIKTVRQQMNTYLAHALLPGGLRLLGLIGLLASAIVALLALIPAVGGKFRLVVAMTLFGQAVVSCVTIWWVYNDIVIYQYQALHGGASYWANDFKFSLFAWAVLCGIPLTLILIALWVGWIHRSPKSKTNC